MTPYDPQNHHRCSIRLRGYDYYERILRDDRAVNAVRRYIQNNPARWQSGDRFARPADALTAALLQAGEALHGEEE